MARQTQRAALVISAEERRSLEQLSQSRKVEKREVERAAVWLRYARGEGITEMHRALSSGRVDFQPALGRGLPDDLNDHLRWG